MPAEKKNGRVGETRCKRVGDVAETNLPRWGGDSRKKVE